MSKFEDFKKWLDSAELGSDTLDNVKDAMDMFECDTGSDDYKEAKAEESGQIPLQKLAEYKDKLEKAKLFILGNTAFKEQVDRYYNFQKKLDNFKLSLSPSEVLISTSSIPGLMYTIYKTTFFITGLDDFIGIYYYLFTDYELIPKIINDDNTSSITFLKKSDFEFDHLDIISILKNIY